jgi:deazaflavin-dependent oxidoreductase (nitroreductase family)
MTTDDTPRRLPQRQAAIVQMAREHLRQYLATDGEEGYYRGASRSRIPSLILTTIGRRSGKPYSTPLYFGEDAGRYILIGSFGGSRTHPDWYLNLVANPAVEVQIRGERFAALARAATPAERPALWALMAALMPGYDTYQAEAGRVIPVVIVERV